MQMRMVEQGLAPGMQHGKKADFGPEVLGVGFWLLSLARFPQMGRTGNFRPAGDWKKRPGERFHQGSARVKTKNGNSFAIFFENGVSGRRSGATDSEKPCPVLTSLP
jgi:hypothetical protein